MGVSGMRGVHQSAFRVPSFQLELVGVVVVGVFVVIPMATVSIQHVVLGGGDHLHLPAVVMVTVVEQHDLRQQDDDRHHAAHAAAQLQARPAALAARLAGVVARGVGVRRWWVVVVVVGGGDHGLDVHVGRGGVSRRGGRYHGDDVVVVV